MTDPATPGGVARAQWLSLLLAGSLLSAAIVGCCKSSSQARANEDPTQAQVEIFIRSGTPCTVGDTNGNLQVTAARKTKVVFVNEMNSDVVVTFGNQKRLFGVREGVVYAGSRQEFRVRDDAEVGNHGYTVDCGTTQPGPIIIVPPPGGGG